MTWHLLSLTIKEYSYIFLILKRTFFPALNLWSLCAPSDLASHHCPHLTQKTNGGFDLASDAWNLPSLPTRWGSNAKRHLKSFQGLVYCLPYDGCFQDRSDQKQPLLGGICLKNHQGVSLACPTTIQKEERDENVWSPWAAKSQGGNTSKGQVQWHCLSLYWTCTCLSQVCCEWLAHGFFFSWLPSTDAWPNQSTIPRSDRLVTQQTHS